MRSRGQGWTNVPRTASLLALATATLAVGSPGGTLQLPMSAGASALTSLTLTSVGSDGAATGAPSTQAAVAANGRYVAFQSQATLAAAASTRGSSIPPHNGSALASRIYVRDLVGRTTTLVSNPADGDATAPDISANGKLVSFEQDGDVYVADRQATGSGPYDSVGNLVVRQVTGTSQDPTYEHVMPCPAGLGAGQSRVTPCGPRLSPDGTTLVYPAELTPVSPALTVTATVENDGSSSDSSHRGDRAADSITPALAGDMVDFTPYPLAYYDQPGGTATVSYANQTSPVTYNGVTITEPPGYAAGEPFEFNSSSCSGTLEPPGSCTVRVTFDGDYCPDSASPQLITGSLLTHSPDPAGQSSVELTALCYASDYGSAVPAGRPGLGGCPAPPQGLALAKAPGPTTDIEGAPLSDAGGAEIGRPYVIWTPVTVPPQAGGTAYVDFAGANGDDCGIQLEDAKDLAHLKLTDPLPSGAPAACSQGEPLESPSATDRAPPPGRTRVSVAAATTPPPECTAYLLISPGAITPDSALLATTYNEGFGITPTVYITMHGVRHVIVARHDLSGSGNFGASPSTVVSVTGSGDILPGAAEPSLSADGRYVGFAAPVPLGSAGHQTAAGASQVWLHDTDKAGTRSYHPGATTLVSCLSRARAGPCVTAPNADSPSVSGDGQQVAFATTAAVRPHNGYPGSAGTGTGSPRTATQVSADQVYVRSVQAGVTTLASAQPSRTKNHVSLPMGGNGPSYAPVITQDSSTVAFVSQATDLTGIRVSAGTANLYLRPALAGTASDEIVSSSSGASLPAGIAAGLPSIDAVGRLVTFPASGALVTGAPPDIASVYTFDRLPHLLSSPPAAGFGRVLLKSTHTLTVTITDTGPGPGTVTGVLVTGSFHVSRDRCAGVTLDQGSHCPVTLTFTPAKPGTAHGMLAVTTQNDDEPPVSGSVPTTATAPTPQLSTSPGTASYGETTQVTGTWFPAGRKLTLRWNPGLGSVVATPSGSGTFTSYMVIFPSDIIGPRTLIAAGSSGTLATAPFLVQEPADEPPFSASQPP